MFGPDGTSFVGPISILRSPRPATHLLQAANLRRDTRAGVGSAWGRGGDGAPCPAGVVLRPPPAGSSWRWCRRAWRVRGASSRGEFAWRVHRAQAPAYRGR